jgi:hypothetical protein
MKRFFNFVTQERRWALLFSLLWTTSWLLIFALAWVLFFAPANARLRIDRMGTIQLLIISPAAILVGAIAGIYYWRSYAPKTGLSIRLYPEGFGDIDYALVERLFHDCQEVRLYPLPGGFSGSLVFQADSWDWQGMLQRPMILKLGPRRKIEAEVQNYRIFVEPFVGNTVVLRGAEYEGQRGAILFTYASMQGKALTFEELYTDAKRNNVDDVVEVIKELFQNTLQLWLAGALPNPHSRLYQTYSLTEDWEEIRQAVSDLGFDPDTNRFDCLGRRFSNPLKEAQKWFKVRQGWECETMETIGHRDPNSRNILIDGNQNVFVIDFAKTGRDHLLRDFCKLEAEIKFCLTRLHCDDDIEQAIALEEELLLAANGEPFTNLESLLNVNPVENADQSLERARRSVVVLRRIASRSMGLQVIGPAEQYYLSLLHYTLDALRYEQCDRNSKLYALISASLLCRALR